MKTTIKIQSNFNKKVIGFGLCALMATSSVYAGEVASEPVSTENEIMLISTGETPINEVQEEVQAPHYASFEGVVTEIVHPYEDSETESANIIHLFVDRGEGDVAYLVISEDTQIIGSSDAKVGDQVKGYYLSDAPMIMIYPAQYPTKILVVGDAPEQAPIFVNDQLVEAPQYFTLEDGTLMLPLRALSEALGFDVTWEDVTRSIRLGVGINLKIGSTSYLVGRMAPIELTHAPVIVEGSTFVPVEFFTEVLGLSEANLHDGLIVLQEEVLEEVPTEVSKETADPTL
ncbi:MAG: copper amine oxidase N-terminal domain-containing protein [Vallitaleaceae bacterium]|nr:copper amine oxidase N-terminal domain-containing protein [Vallitaleaceae bacterium]